MDSLPDALLLDILSRLNDSAEETRLKLVSRSFDAVSRNVRSINLQSSYEMYLKARSRVPNSPQIVIPFKQNFLKVLSKLNTVESIRISTEMPIPFVPNNADQADDLFISDGDFVKQWIHRVSGDLKSLSISDFVLQSISRRSNILPLLSVYCSKLIEFKLRFAWLSLDELNPMPTLTSLSLELIKFVDDELNVFNTCFPNLQVLNLIGVGGFKPSTIHLLNVKAFNLNIYNVPSYLKIIMPNLEILKLECREAIVLEVDTPMVIWLHLVLDHVNSFTIKPFENLNTVLLESVCIGSLLVKFPVTESVQNLTVDSRDVEKEEHAVDQNVENTKFTLGKVFAVFPNVRSLCIKPGAWETLEERYNPLGWESWDGRKDFKILCAYLSLADPELTFTIVAILLNQCVGLSEVTFFIHRDAVDMNDSQEFISKCMARWSGLKWKWGVWKEGTEDSWMSVSV